LVLVADELKKLGCKNVTVMGANEKVHYNTTMDRNGNISEKPTVNNNGSFVPFKGR